MSKHIAIYNQIYFNTVETSLDTPKTLLAIRNIAHAIELAHTNYCNGRKTLLLARHINMSAISFSSAVVGVAAANWINENFSAMLWHLLFLWDRLHTVCESQGKWRSIMKLLPRVNSVSVSFFTMLDRFNFYEFQEQSWT